MEISQAVLRGKTFVEKRRTLILGLSPNNPHYHRHDALERLFNFSRNNSDKVFLFIPIKLAEHNFRAIGKKNAVRDARLDGNSLRNKCNEVAAKTGLCDKSYGLIDWENEVETSPVYTEAYQYLTSLYHSNKEFGEDVRNLSMGVLKSLVESRVKEDERKKTEECIDIEEAVKYPLKEMAFFVAVPRIYTHCAEWVFVYHRRSSLFEKFVDGHYDGIVRSSIGYFIFE